MSNHKAINSDSGAAQLLDVIKQEWGEAWSEWDQSIRDGISEQLRRIYASQSTK